MHIDPNQTPQTVKEAVDALVHSFDDQDCKFIEDEKPHAVHFSAGRMIRNEWNLWEKDTPLKRDAVNTYGIAHADDISGLIFAWTFAKIKGQSFDPIEYCQEFHAHWQKHGTNSLAAGGWPPSDVSSSL